MAGWLLFSVLISGGVHLYLNAQYHNDDDLQAALIQRMEMNGSWDQDKQQQLNEFLALYPEYSDTAPLKEQCLIGRGITRLST